ncbi:hypothetical protein MHU86_11514 [Fragilaria crotonensis]|nr:hypothetical protein MHU86_11514 [Fragilaria crotonensis]
MQSGMTVTASIAAMRLSAMVAGALVSSGASHLPQALTPLVRALMTSLKSEVDADRIELTCNDLVNLLKLLFSEGRVNVHDKILDNICNIMMEGDVSTSVAAAERIVASMIHDIPAGDTVQIFSPIWHRLVYLENGNLETVDNRRLQETLRLLTAVGQAMVPRSRAVKHLISLTIHPLILTSCMSADTASRNAAVSCIKAFAKADSSMTLDKAIPLLAGHLREKGVDAFRLGACKVMYSIIEEVDIEVCPFVRYLLLWRCPHGGPSGRVFQRSIENFCSVGSSRTLVQEVASVAWSLDMDDHAKSVMDHLILESHYRGAFSRNLSPMK